MLKFKVDENLPVEVAALLMWVVEEVTVRISILGSDWGLLDAIASRHRRQDSQGHQGPK